MGAQFRVIAHRGATTNAPGNTIAAFRSAKSLGVDAVELDVRLSRDGVPIVHHNYYLDREERRPIFQLTAPELERALVADSRSELSGMHPIPKLAQVLNEFAGSLGLEIELKGPELNASARVATLLADHKQVWESIEITSSHVALLLDFAERCPAVATALLFPASEPWMHEDVLAYAALHQASSARASAVHLHANQLTDGVVSTIRSGGVDVHAHSVNDQHALELVASLQVTAICTDEPALAVAFRR